MQALTRIELPQRQQRALAFPKLVAGVVPVLEVLGDVVEGVLVDRALEHLGSPGHILAGEGVLQAQQDTTLRAHKDQWKVDTK
eukprot:scaffold82046_cov40-Prasinocladus_malaysianus.AAC.1